ncbi:MAG TPA: heparinase II/III family protein, partial [Geminicoccaceae bacterium]
MSLTWYARRLARMSPAEMRGRMADAWLKQRWRTRQLRPGEADPLPLPASLPAFASPLDPAAADALPEEARARLLRSADAALEGRFPLFDRERTDLSRDPDWFLDPRTGRRAPDAAYAFDIDYRDVREVGTIKYVWEPSRHHQLTVLAAAFFLTSDPRYADLAAAQLRSWWRRNPFLSGVHWTSGIELGVRLLSWVWVRRLLDGWSGVAALFEDNPDFLRQLHHHQDYLARLKSHGSSANNHLIAEQAGQFAACCAFPYFAETPSWREAAAAALRREANLQTFESGLNRELASSYHVFVLELLLAAAVEGEAAHHPLDAELWQRICAMTDALAAIVDVGGRAPRQGDGDHGRGLVLDHPDADPCASLLASGAALFGARDWWPDQRAPDLRTLLWRRLTGGMMPAGARPAALRHRFGDAGVVLLRDRPHAEDEIWCRCDHGPHGFLSIAAHAHA